MDNFRESFDNLWNVEKMKIVNILQIESNEMNDQTLQIEWNLNGHPTKIQRVIATCDD